MPVVEAKKANPQVEAKLSAWMDGMKMSADDRESCLDVARRAYSEGYKDGYNDSPKK